MKMRSNTLFYFFHMLVPVISLLSSGCYKDKGNYRYKNINEITIKGLDTVIQLLQGDSLQLSPDDIQGLLPGGTYTYHWRFGPVDAPAIADTGKEIASGKVLKTVLTQSPGTYTLEFFVRDETTGITSSWAINIVIYSKYRGLYLLETGSKGGDISFINLKDSSYHAQYTAFNGGALLQFPLRSLSGSYFEDNNKRQQYLFVFAGSDPVELYSEQPLKMGNLSKLFTPLPKDYAPVYFAATKQNAFCISNGLLYSSNNSVDATTLRFSSPYSGDYFLAPFLAIATNSGGALLTCYDEKNGRFLYAPFMRGELHAYSFDDGGAFNLDSIHQHCIFASSSSDDNSIWIMKDGTGNLYSYLIHSGATDASVVAGYNRIDPAKAPGLGTDSIMAASTSQPYLYYAAGNQLYMYDYTTNTAIPVYTFDIRETITAVMFSKANDVHNGDLLYAATYNGDKGKVYVFSADKDAGNIPVKSFDGFGRVISLFFK
ncbi:MAG TPA: PKD-like family lipoprotein [Chitinophaga sp.]|uniref:PKD-like family lipoprotein n=1 Tax=Chitinophaga sp. TaxID=1869181 RepID=UPI002D071025|nr:PKD-like family lipoprotein [Chitinophaga sp.]HVI48451.1 PKD-like family lipoprotein [Chitinophaga sp.]